MTTEAIGRTPGPTADSAIAVPARRGGHRRWVRLADQVILGVIIFGGWWWLVSGNKQRLFKFSTPGAVLQKAWDSIRTGSLWPQLFTTLEELIVGFVIGLLIALVIAAVLSEFPYVFKLIDPVLIGIYSIPNAALAPVFIIWFGIGIESKVILVALTTFFIVFYEVHTALQGVSRGLVDAMRLMGSGRKDVYLKVMLPASRDWIVHACRLAFPRAFTAAVIGEIIAANRGLGYLARYQAGVYDAAGALSTLLIIMCITVPMHYLLAAWRTKAKT